MKKSNPQSTFPVLFVTVLLMAFGAGPLAAINAERLSPELAAGTDVSAADLQVAATCEWRDGDAYKIHWPQLPDLGSTGADVRMSLVCLADDFKCTATGPINDIHLWGSFAQDVLPQGGPGSLTIEFSIYSDVPAGAGGWSMPGQLLWARTFYPGEYSVRLVHDGPEDWYDAESGLYLPDDHRRTYQYNFCIQNEPFIQQEGQIYWLSVTELSLGGTVSGIVSAAQDIQSPGSSCGTLNVAGDLALTSASVYVWELEAGCSDLINVGGSLSLETGWTLKIETSQPPIVGDYLLFTYGANLSLGSPVFDVTGAPGWEASNLSVVDNPAEKKVYLRVGAERPALRYSFGWKTTTAELGWNDNAVCLPAGAAGLPAWFPLTYPAGHRYAAEALNLAFVINGGDQTKPEHDLGDAPDSSNSFPATPMLAYPASGVVANYPTVYGAGSPPYGPIHREPEALMYLGRRVSLENEADIGFDEDAYNNLNPPADLSDLDDADDGVQLPLVLPHCQRATFTYVVTTVGSISSPVYVNVWCDWNRDGDWDDTVDCPTGGNVPEWAVQNQQLLLVGTGTFNITTPQFMCWHPQDVAEPPPMWVRITLAERSWGVVASSAVHGGSGLADGYRYGETEDYYIYPKKEAGPSEYDWGDAPDPPYPTLSLSSGANHVIAGPWLGDQLDSPDPDPDGQPNANALGDDTDGYGDEDGATIPPLIPGRVADIALGVCGGGGVVQGWIDFDADGTWQASEQIYDGFLPNGTHTISCSVPDSAVAGHTFARFRISRQGGLDPKGPARDGEVEDYEVFIKPLPFNTKWVQLPDVTNRGIDIRVDSNDGHLRTLADDFECRSRSLITDVHLWGSWKDDKKGLIKRIHLSIHSDDPAGPDGADPNNRFSKPAPEVLWEEDFLAGQFEEVLYHVVRYPGEWWWDPVTGQLGPGGDAEIWQIDIDIDPADAFLQTGSSNSPVIYWLAVQVDTEDGEFGWKTRRWPDHYMDDAVWEVFFGLLPHVWKELRYPETHPYYSLERNSIDMAFCLTYTDEAPEQPTSRPGSITRCPVVETRCPSLSTKCPPLKTRCPVLSTRCPVQETRCPPLSTRCPPIETECRTLPTVCPPLETRCRNVPTVCPPVETECPPPETQCGLMITTCPPTDTTCPALMTQCPVYETRCPPDSTKCPTYQTRCPADPTRCPAQETKCPPEETKCPPQETKCPPQETKCYPVDTKCPPKETECPPVETKCPPAVTKCPPRDTECPPVETQCPPEETECHEVETECPSVRTQCPKCYITVGAICFGVPEGTKSFPVTALCPAIDVQCPSVVPELVSGLVSAEARAVAGKARSSGRSQTQDTRPKT
jgi:hypothetical protein